MQFYKTKREKLEVLRAQLINERQSFIPHWREIGEYVSPRRPRFLTSDVNKGDARNSKIIDSTATLAARTQRAGMMSGVTSPARPWFRLTTPDPNLSEDNAVKQWLYLVTQRMSTVFLQSNIYNSLPVVYGDMGTFGTSALLIEEDDEYVFRSYPFPIGSYMIATDHRLKVNTFMREFRMTVRQLIEKFGKRNAQTGEIDWSNFSTYVKNQYEQGQLEAWVDVVHAIVPNTDYNPKKLESKFKKYSSCYYEQGSLGSAGNYMVQEQDTYLRESGYDYFPVLCPRWETTGEDAYATSCPGMDSLGDNKGLQTLQKRKAQAIEKMVNPPMTGPSALKAVKTSILPGDITYSDEREGVKGFRPVHEVDPKIRELLLDIQDHQQRIKRAYFEDLFLMMSATDRREITAREVDERHEEKLLALGPVLEQLNQDLLDPLIDIVFALMLKQGLIPPAPDDLQGFPLIVEYVSIMASAQKLIAVSGVERFASFSEQLAANNPGIRHKINYDNMLDVYGDLTSIPAGIVRTDEEAEQIRAQLQKQMQAQQTAENIPGAASAVKQLSETNLEDDSALKRVLDRARAGQAVETN